jgi:acetylornithine/N-succinyldiaminopimelate aminotransferase
MENSFHGRTLATIATGQTKYQHGFAPIPAGFEQVPFNDFDAIVSFPHHDVAAVILEPIQGEGGIRMAENMYLQKLRNYCDEHDIILIFDEVQCGVGRTGYLFAKDYFDVQPDIMTLAKGLGGGMPIGAFLCNEKVGNAIEFGDHGTTFGGNPLASSAALATLKVIQEEDLLAEAKQKGEWLMKELEGLKVDYPQRREIRGLGLMIGVVLDQPAAPIVKQLMHKGIIANATAETVLRLVPPLNIPKADLKTFLTAFSEILTEIAEHAK